MNQKELNEIRRRIKPERSSIDHIYGCYVNSNREIISYIDESLGLLSKEETEKYLALMKKDPVRLPGQKPDGSELCHKAGGGQR